MRHATVLSAVRGPVIALIAVLAAGAASTASAAASASGELKPLSRMAYFNGKLLSADDFAAEQEYFRGAGGAPAYGRIDGLRVTLGAGGRAVLVSAGFGVTADGRRLTLKEPLTLRAPRGEGRWHVVLCGRDADGRKRCLRLAVLELRAGKAHLVPVERR